MFPHPATGANGVASKSAAASRVRTTSHTVGSPIPSPSPPCFGRAGQRQAFLATGRDLRKGRLQGRPERSS